MLPVLYSQKSALGRHRRLNSADRKEPGLWKEAVGRMGWGANMQGEQGRHKPHSMLRPLPDKPVLSSTPESVGPHGRCGDAFHPVCMVSKHVDRFLYCQVVDMHFGVGCPRDQDAVPSVRQELLQRDRRRDWQAVWVGLARKED